MSNCIVLTTEHSIYHYKQNMQLQHKLTGN